MSTRVLPRIADVASVAALLTLRVRWTDGTETIVDVSDLIRTFRVFAPLRDDDALFRQVRVGEHGTDIVWTDDIDMAVETLWRLSVDQVGDDAVRCIPLIRREATGSEAAIPASSVLANAAECDELGHLEQATEVAVMKH